MDLHIDSRDIRVTVQDIISVQDDTNTQVIEFVFTKELLEYALWELNAFVIYAVSGSTGVRFDICTKTVTDSELKVQWVIRKPVTYAEGKLQFQVVFTDTPDPITKVSEHRWSTKIATVTIPKTLAREKYAIDTEPVIEQMMAIAAQCVEAGDKISRAEAAAVRAEQAADSIQEAVDANNAAQAAKTETISAKNATIAAAQLAQLEAQKVKQIVAGNEAYTKAESDQKYTTAPTKTAIGIGTIVLDDCDQGSIPVGFMGASEQYTATGTNLFDVKQLVKNMKALAPSTTVVLFDDGAEVIEFSNTSFHDKRTYEFKNDITKSYKFGVRVKWVSGSDPGSLYIRVKYKDGSDGAIAGVGKALEYTEVSGTIPQGKEIDYIYFSFGTGAKYRLALDRSFLYPTDAPSDEKPTGGYGTPSPEYPSEVRSVGDIPKDSNGVEIRNLLDEEWIKSQPISGWQDGTNNAYGLDISKMIPKEKRKGLNFEAWLNNINNISAIDAQVYLSFSIVGGNNQNAVMVAGNGPAKGVATDLSIYDSMYFVIWKNTSSLSKEEIIKYYLANFRYMLSYSGVDEYRPYIGDNNACLHVINQDSAGNNVTDDYIILKEPLRGIPDGQGGWLARDVIDSDGNVVQTVIKHTWDGASGGLYASPGMAETLIAISGTVSGLSAYKKRQGLSNKFGFISSPSSVQKEVASVANTLAFLVIEKERLETADLAGIKKWLKEQYDAKEPVIQYLATETPITYKIALPDFKTSEGRTLIMTPSGTAPLPDIFAEYKQTVKGSAIEAITEDKNRKIYGVEITRQANGDIQSSPTLTRTDDAVGMTARASTDGNAVVNDFDTAPDWPRLIRCNGYYTDTGQFVVTAYKGEPGYKEDGSNGNVWVQIERFYHEHVETAEKITDRISTKPFPGAILPDIFVGKDGKPLRYAYKGAYEGATVGGKLVSYSGVKPGGHSMNTAIAQARAAGPYYHIGTTSENEIIRLLIQIEFATLNGQAAIGNGVSTLRYTSSPVDMATVATTNSNKIIVANATAALFVVGQYIGIGATATSGSIAEFRKITGIATYDSANKAITFDGAAVNIPVGSFISSRVYYTGNADGVKASSGTMSNDGKHANIYRGFENPFGNCWEVMGDVIFHNGQSTYYKCANPDKWVTNSTLSDDYIPLCYAPSPTEGYVKAFGYDKRFPYSRLTTKVGGSSATYYCDYFYRPPVITSPDTLREVLLGGNFNNGALDGPGCWHLYAAVSFSDWDIAGRLSGTGCGGLGEPSPSDQTTDTTE